MSKTIRINVIAEPLVQFIKTGKGPTGGYNTLEVAFKESGKVGGKKLVDFTNKEVFEFVKSLKPGDQADVVIEKEAGSDGVERWQWKSIRAADGTQETVESNIETTAERGTPPTSQRAVGRVTGSNYETPEERAIRRAFDREKQHYIVAQSSVDYALKYLSWASEPVTLEEVLNTANRIYAYVFSKNPESQAEQAAQVVKEATPVQAAVVKPRGRPAKAKTAVEEVAEMDDDLPF